MKSLASVLSTAAMLLSSAVPVMAQHNHTATPWHHDVVIVDPHGHYVREHHDHYNYVVPPTQQQHGTYYTHENQRYYYEAPRVAYRPGVQVAERPPEPIRPSAVEFGGFSHVDDLASRLETMANDLCLDLHYNYRHNPGFDETYGEAYQIMEAAQYAHGKEHNGDRQALARAITQMDPLFHHVEEDVTGWSRDHHRQIGQLGIIDKMQQMENLIHHLLYDAGIKPAHDEQGHGGQAPAPDGGVQRAPRPAGLPPRNFSPPN